ncbi:MULTISPECIES: hypothetical protein [Asticcacaulis]|uniref:hypothetical protein n=1 Tax=Asticcacaulis TaxID=76890 RepID=UPI001AE16829|nr:MULTISPECIES: hypothetical protein [Asticcacaulis]MBP2161089.1 hypothetical protein [Asticcacaulis solisilvae]MDR6802134.1 hypothetical protein [Asticcacaulis sp. BE141]
MSETKEVMAARLALQTRNASIRMSARITPAGLLAVGGLVGMILLATAVLVRASRARR